ncbi:probable ATP-dependent RNA helicase DDX46 [Hibiscus syriacus]|uniref:probable ATP-dependent RNA helicase DDX46 n=1 Tax=Hibiscus syriacus TaxID=106335 RepID=UPI001923D127|nr:probable ATP-dependent RNA helicase DDX46 [Hibiscus syriacus]
MGKSSSLKKKRSKDSSQSRKRKRSKVKSKKSKSKKLCRRRDDSVSYSSDTEPVSSSTSEDDCRSRRSQSRYRKGRKKRSRRWSYNKETCEDSPNVKKRRGSRRGDTRKRTSKRKKSTRGGSVSSSGSRSLSCSKSERKEKYGRSEKVKRGSKRRKGRSRSFSSCSRYSEGSDYSIEGGVLEDGNSRRLKSVITVFEQVNESFRELIANEPIEDVYDRDDYPSCRSNDSNDGGGQRELRQHTHTVSEMIKPPDDEQVGVSHIKTSNAEEINVSSVTDGLNGDDIESILRQRTLENLKKLRGELQKKINPPTTQNDKSPTADDGRVVVTSQASQQIRRPLDRRDSSTLPKDDRNTTNTSDDGKYSKTRVYSVSNKPKLVISRVGLDSPNTCNSQKQVVVTQEPSQASLVTETSVDEASVSIRPKSAKSRIGQEPPNTCTTLKQEFAALESPQPKLATESSLGESNLTAQTVSPDECGNPVGRYNDTCDSTCDKTSPSGNVSSDKQEDETKDGSQFQQKTMSVMRGGEMVQVSYQVYIPKRAPALARRQLKR